MIINTEKRPTGGKRFKKKDIPLSERRAYLDKIREGERMEALKPMKGRRNNKVSSFFGHAGVYYLFDGKKLVYIGESNCILYRISQHMSNKKFDSFQIRLEKDERKRKQLECREIKRYAPLYNITHNPNITAP
jgi:hypothetical protein